MESMGKKKPRPRRSFTPEFKAEIVELCRRGDRSVGQIAKDFDLTETREAQQVHTARVLSVLRPRRRCAPPGTATSGTRSRQCSMGCRPVRRSSTGTAQPMRWPCSTG